MSEFVIPIDMDVAESQQSIDMGVSEQIIPAPYNWMGRNVELVKTFPEFSVLLKDTDFNTWTPSTTATKILSTESFGTFNADMANFDYIIQWIFDTDLKYSSATNSAMPVRQYAHTYQELYRRPRPYNLETHVNDQNAYNNNFNNCPIIKYYNTSGTLTCAYTQAYGFYMSQASPSFSDLYDDNVTVTLNRPDLYARCNTTYFSTNSAGGLNKNTSKLYVKCNVYRVSKPNAQQQISDLVIDDFLGV